MRWIAIVLVLMFSGCVSTKARVVYKPMPGLTITAEAICQP